MGEKRKSTGTKVAPAEKRKKIIQNSLKDETTTLAKVVKEAEADVKRTTAYTNNVSSITAFVFWFLLFICLECFARLFVEMILLYSINL